MRIAIVGGGPAGLYLAILLKKADRDLDVAVFERNPPDATFGWGVVFSEDTLGALRDADQETYLAITDTFARWDRVDIRYRGRVLRSQGHSFSAIARKRLLEILQRRCFSLGVDLTFGVEVAEEPDDADLVVAADGVNSLFRKAHERELGTSVEPEGCKYVWFGTDLVFDAFTFIFRDTEHGLLQVHAYPFDERTSTFIVECPEPTWRRAGLDELGEEDSLAFCEQLFARDLEGHELALEPLALARLPEGREQGLAPRPNGAPGRRRAHRPLLDRLGHEARHGGRDRAQGRARAPRLGRRGRARRLRARASARRGADAAGRQRERRLLRPGGELPQPGADPVRLQPAHAKRPHQPREPHRPRPGLHAHARFLVHGNLRGRGPAADVRSTHAAEPAASEPRGRAARKRRRPGPGSS